MPSGLAGDIDTAVDTVAQVASQTQAAPSGSGLPPAKTPSADPTQPSAVRGSGDSPATPSSPPGVQGKHPQATRNAPVPATVASSPIEDNNDPDAVLKSTQAIPPQRLPKIFDNVRKKESERLSKVYGMPADEWERGGYQAHVEGLRTNPVQYYQQLGNLLKSYGLMPDSAAPTSPGTTPAAPMTVPAEMPQPDLRAEDGRLAYSAEATQKLVAWQMQQFEKKLTDRYQPVEQEVTSVRAERLRTTADSHAKDLLAQADRWPNFADVKPRVLALMQADGRRTLHTAYIEAIEEYEPQRKSKVRDEVLKELRTAPTVPTTTAPSSSVPRTVNSTRSRNQTLDERLDSAIRSAIDQHSA